MASLDTSIRHLLKVITQIQSHGNVDFLKTSKPYWHLCTEKFHAAYTKAKNPDGFRDMFHSFFDKHQDKFTDSVVDEEGDINDEWLKNKEVVSKKKSKKSNDELSFSLKNINCRGEVIYFDESNEKIRNVCIPISEAYIAAVKIYVDGAKKGEYSPLPALLLHALFCVVGHITDENFKDDVTTNIKALKEVIDSLVSDETPSSSSGTGSTLNPISDVIKNFASKFGLNDANGNMNMGNIEKTVSNLFSDDMTSKVKNIFTTFTDKVKIDGNADIGTIMANVTEAMKDPELQSSLKETIADVAAKVGFGEIKISEEDNQKIVPENATVDTQE